MNAALNLSVPQAMELVMMIGCDFKLTVAWMFSFEKNNYLYWESLSV